MDSMNRMSLHLNRDLVDQASHSLKQLEEAIRDAKGSKALQDEYSALIEASLDAVLPVSTESEIDQ